ncbi:MAG: hypothetical protein ABIP50_02325 [Candidatus Saccharimonadales bacterium]
MEFINKIEATVGGWAKNVPHLPPAAQKWIATNVWWIALVGAILTGVAMLFSLFGLLLGGIGASYIYVINPYYTTVILISGIVDLAFLVVRAILLGTAVKPLQNKKQKGWDLLFFALLVQAVAIVISAVFNLVAVNILGFMLSIIFGAVGVAVTAYFLFEIHGQFAHVKTVKAKATAKKA